MKERASSTEVIYDSNGDVIAEAVIGSSSIRKFQLMDDDYIKLCFVLDEAVFFPIGSYVEDEIFGKFVITEEQMPKYQSATDSYYYELQFDAEYMTWKNKIFMLTNVITGTSMRVRKESTWTLTDKLEAHLQEVINNLDVLFGSEHGYTFEVDDDLETAYEVHCISYEGVNIIDALTAIADEYECEWWVDSDKVLHLGKCESDDDAMEWSLDNQTIGSMDIQDDRNTYANKIYVYGSTSNLPASYRKDLLLEAETKETDSITMFTPANSRHFTNDMFPDPTWSKTNTSVFTIQEETLEPETYEEFDEGDNTIVWTGGEVNIPYPGESTITLDAFDYTLSYILLNEPITYKQNAYTTLKIELVLNTVRYTIATITNTYTEWRDPEEYDEDERKEIMDDILMHTGKRSVTLRVEHAGNYHLEATVTVLDNETSGATPWDIESLMASGDLKVTVATKHDISGKPIKVFYGNKPYYVRFNPLDEAKGDDDFYKFTFCDLVGAISTSSIPSGFDTGSIAKISTDGVFLVPSAYYATDYDNPSSLLSIGDNRLRLPSITGDFLVKDASLTEAQLVEKIIAFDDVYPSGKLYAQAVEAEEKKDYTEYEGEEEKNDWQWHEYTLTPYLFSTKAAFTFDSSYRLADTELQIRFLTPNDVGISEAEAGDGYKLAGMTFAVQFNTSSKTFTIVRNEDFGALLPNDVLKPTEGDPFVLIGWNPNAMHSLGLIADAEARLLAKGQEYLEAIEESQFTFTCTMQSDWMFGLVGNLNLVTSTGESVVDSDEQRLIVKNGNTVYMIPGEGSKVTIHHDALNGKTKTSRVIGYELKLDKPYDSPKYVVGETDAYSRLAKIEKEITNISN